MSFDRKARDTKEKYAAQENEGVVRNFLLGGVTEVPLTSCLILDMSLKIEKRGSPVVPVDDSRDKNLFVLRCRKWECNVNQLFLFIYFFKT